MNTAASISRRELFSRLFNRAHGSFANGSAKTVSSVKATEVPRVAVVQGRFCLAYLRSFCSTCVERCPVPGAVVVENHLPRIVPDLCTGCGICHEVCPAPRNGILIVPRQRILPSLP